MPETALYAALLALLFALLSLRTIRARRASGIAIGHADDARVLRAMRVHANFAEYVPFVLLLMLLLELGGAPRLLVHGLGCALLAGRLLHAWGVSRDPERFAFRVTGMALTLGALLVGAMGLLTLAAMPFGR